MDYYTGLLFVLTLLLQFRGYLCGSSCYEREYNIFYGNYYYSYYGYCSYGCCGYTTSRYCCYAYYDAYTSVSISVGVIVGSIIGGLVFLGVLITVVICCICKCSDRKPNRGAVVAPATGGTQGVAIVSTHLNMQPQQYYQMHSRPAQIVQPPAYNTGHISVAYPQPQPPTCPPPAYPPPPPAECPPPPPDYPTPPPAECPPPPPNYHPSAAVEEPETPMTPFEVPDLAPSGLNNAPPASTQVTR
ncbi:protein shisa-5-like [Ylistrum balloti]|uniref:protein shisa-5-like n=1 Tax=Ylistrum balloti TaxID=509963 RepID=UPI002905C5E1|nr:protein shisa-5-like [Ylistrum balloti]